MISRSMLSMAALGLLTLGPWGCGPAGGPRPPMGKVHGKVSYKGVPLPRGTISFAPVSGEKGNRTGIGAIGQIASDGSYDLTTFDSGDGAVVGQHSVTISIQSEAGAAMKNMPSDPSESVKVAHEQNLIPPIYTDPTKTPLKYTVDPGENTINIDLKDQPGS